MSAESHNAASMIDESSHREVRGDPLGREARVSFCATGPRPERVYSHAVLLELKMHPLAQIWPEYLGLVYKNTRGVWDPDRWHLDQKRSETPVTKHDGDEVKKDEKDVEKNPETAIILSPQRASFLSGCQAAKDELNLRPDQPGAGRRVGSGRILRPEKEDVPPQRGARVRIEREPAPPRDWDQRELSKYGFRREDEERRGWEERREPYPDERDARGMDRRRGRGGSIGGGGVNRRRDNEPEWMHESVALTDIIELKGFDDKGGRGSRPNSRQSIKSDHSAAGGRGPRQHSGPGCKTSGNNPATGIVPAQEKDGFNFDHIMESMNSLLDGGVAEEEPVQGVQPGQSRFSQFFQPRAEPGTQSRRSSIQDELLGNNILREINGEPMIKIPSPNDSNKYFTPISPAAKTVKGKNVLLEMLQKGNQNKTDETIVQKLEDGIKRSLGLEDGIRAADDELKRSLGLNEVDPRLVQLQQQVLQQQAAQLQHQQRPQPVQDNDLSAFKKLVAQVKGQPAECPPAPGFLPGLVRPTPISSLPATALTEHDILEGRGGQRFMGFSALPIQLLQFLEGFPLNREVIKRSEAEHLINCISNGTVPMESLVPHLSNPALPTRQRELILNVLKLKTMSSGLGVPAPQIRPRSSPLNEFFLSQPPPIHHSRVSPLLFSGSGGPGSSHLSVSPVPQTQRVPSPQEMTVLTQHILQQALIKKKLEEQKENYRRKHETGKQDEKENIRGFRAHENGSSSSPLAFTPTSVMRKNAADRKDSDPRGGVPELKITGQEEQGVNQAPVSPGRPILKGGVSERPMVLDLGGGRSTWDGPQAHTRGHQHSLPGAQSQHLHGAHGQHLPAGLLAGGQNMPAGLLGGGQQNPLLYLANQQMPPAVIGHGGVPQFNGHLNALFGGRFPQQNMMGGHSLGRAEPPSPRGVGRPSPAPNTLSRFFSNDVLAAAAASGGVGPPKMPPLPTGQALTLEEIERHASAVKI